MVNGAPNNFIMRKLPLSYKEVEVEMLIYSGAHLLCFGKDQLWWCLLVV